MNKDIRNSIIAVIIGLIFQFGMTTLVSMIFIKGEIIKEDVLKVDSVNYRVNLIINNYSDKSINGIKLHVSDGIIKSYLSNKFISLESKNNIVKLSEISANKNYIIQLDLISDTKNKSAIPNFEILNYNDLGLNYKESGDLHRDYVSNIINAIIYAIIFFVFYYLSSRETSKSFKKMEEVKDESKKLEFRITKAEHNLNKYLVSFGKTRLLYLRELRDYKKENIFYRQLIDKIIGKQKDNSSVDYAEIITSELKTFSTKKTEPYTYDTIDIIADLTKEKNNSDVKEEI